MNDDYENPEPKKNHIILKSVIVTVIVMSLLIVAAYFILVNYNESQQEAATIGVQFILGQISSTVASCQPYPIQIGNDTLNLVLFECVQAGAFG